MIPPSPFIAIQRMLMNIMILMYHSNLDLNIICMQHHIIKLEAAVLIIIIIIIITIVMGMERDICSTRLLVASPSGISRARASLSAIISHKCLSLTGISSRKVLPQSHKCLSLTGISFSSSRKVLPSSLGRHIIGGIPRIRIFRTMFLTAQICSSSIYQITSETRTYWNSLSHMVMSRLSTLRWDMIAGGKVMALSATMMLHLHRRPSSISMDIR